MALQIECPECGHKHEVTYSRGEKDEFGYLKTSIGHRIAELAMSGMNREKVSLTLYNEEINDKAKSPSLHTGRVNRVFSEIRGQIKKANKSKAKVA